MRRAAKVLAVAITWAYLWPLALALSFFFVLRPVSLLPSASVSSVSHGDKAGSQWDTVCKDCIQALGLDRGQGRHIQVFFHDNRSGPSPGLGWLLLVLFFLPGSDWASCGGWGVCSEAFRWPLQVRSSCVYVCVCVCVTGCARLLKCFDEHAFVLKAL